MDFSLSADQREIQALAREFAAAEIEPNAAAWDREHRFPRDLREARRARSDGRVRPRRSTAAQARTSSPTCSCSRSSRAPTPASVSRSPYTRAPPRCPCSPSARTSRRAASSRRSHGASSWARSRSPRRRPARTRARSELRPSRTARGGRSRREAVDHEREPCGHLRPLRPHRPGHRRPRRRLGLHPRRRARARHARGGEARPQLVFDRGPRRRRRPGRPRPAAPRGEARLHGRDGDARRWPDRHRRAGCSGSLRPPTTRARAYALERHQFGHRIADFRASSGSWPTWPPRSTPHGCSCTTPRG